MLSKVRSVAWAATLCLLAAPAHAQRGTYEAPHDKEWHARQIEDADQPLGQEPKPQAAAGTPAAAKVDAEAPSLPPVEARTRFELGLRSGYGLPLGGVAADTTDLNTLIAGQVPIWLDVGARFSEQLFFGVHASYGFGMLAGDISSACDAASATSCHGSDVRVGFELLYFPRLSTHVEPWFGGGMGAEILSFEAKQATGGTAASIDGGANGMQVFMAQAGVDLKLTRGIGIGPFLAFSSDIFFTRHFSCSGACGDTPLNASSNIENKSVHHWVFLGARGSLRL